MHIHGTTGYILLFCNTCFPFQISFERLFQTKGPNLCRHPLRDTLLHLAQRPAFEISEGIDSFVILLCDQSTLELTIPEDGEFSDSLQLLVINLVGGDQEIVVTLPEGFQQCVAVGTGRFIAVKSGEHQGEGVDIVGKIFLQRWDRQVHPEAVVRNGGSQRTSVCGADRPAPGLYREFDGFKNLAFLAPFGGKLNLDQQQKDPQRSQDDQNIDHPKPFQYAFLNLHLYSLSTYNLLGGTLEGSSPRLLFLILSRISEGLVSRITSEATEME